MRRLGIVVVVLLLVLCGVYTAAWFFVADRIKQEIIRWADGERPRNLDASWATLDIAGFPLAFRIKASEVRLRDRMRGREAELHTPVLSARARPWNFGVWQIAATAGLSAFAGPAEAPRARLTADAGKGEIVLGDDRRTDVTLDLENLALDAGGKITAGSATVSVSVPETPPQTHTEPALGLAVEARGLQPPSVPAALRPRSDTVSFAVRVLGPVPDLPPLQAAELWRDAGGTLELDRLAVHWGELGITGSGTAALDREMQPEGAFSGSVQGYDQLMSALTEAGVVGGGGLAVARLGLALLSKPGPNGKPQIPASFTIQNGEMFLGPAKLGKAPRIDWE